MRIHLRCLMGLLLLIGCEGATTNPGAMSSREKPPAADNSAVNERDRAGTSKTPIDQNENTADIKTTAEIRKRVMAEPDFSVNAQNVKIITADGEVTLRGPVANSKERDKIETIAREVAGKDKVISKIEVVP